MDTQPIQTEADYEAALKVASAFFDHEPEPGSEDAERFDLLVTLIQAWEAKHYPIGVAET